MKTTRKNEGNGAFSKYGELDVLNLDLQHKFNDKTLASLAAEALKIPKEDITKFAYNIIYIPVNHPNVRYILKYVFFNKETKKDYPCDFVSAVELKDVFTKENYFDEERVMKIMYDIVNTFFPLNDLIAFYDPVKISNWYLTRVNTAGNIRIVRASSFALRDVEPVWEKVHDGIYYKPLMLNRYKNLERWLNVLIFPYDDERFAGYYASRKDEMFQSENRTVTCDMFRLDLHKEIENVKEFRFFVKDEKTGQTDELSELLTIELSQHTNLDNIKKLVKHVVKSTDYHPELIAIHDPKRENGWYLATLENGVLQITDTWVLCASIKNKIGKAV